MNNKEIFVYLPESEDKANKKHNNQLEITVVWINLVTNIVLNKKDKVNILD